VATKPGGRVSRLTIFAKGNLDVRDSLHALRLGGTLVWNGLNEILRARSSPAVARIRHQTWTRSDALLEATGTVPAALAERNPPLGAHPAASQFSSAVFETDADVIVLSAQPDLSINLLRHRRDGFLLYPDGWDDWPPEDRVWLRESFVSAGLLDMAASMANFARIVARIRERSSAPILIYNVSSVTPGEQIHAHDGMDDIFSTRIRRFNLGLIELSQQTGVSLIDVDMIVARAGADRLKYDALHLTAEGCRAVAEEVARVLEDLGCLSPAEAGT
jgi:hypothetical protein